MKYIMNIINDKIFTLYNNLLNNDIRNKKVIQKSKPGDLGSITGHVIPKTRKMVLYTALLNTQQYIVRIKGKVEQFRERSSALPYSSV